MTFFVYFRVDYDNIGAISQAAFDLAEVSFTNFVYAVGGHTESTALTFQDYEGEWNASYAHKRVVAKLIPPDVIKSYDTYLYDFYSLITPYVNYKNDGTTVVGAVPTYQRIGETLVAVGVYSNALYAFNDNSSATLKLFGRNRFEVGPSEGMISTTYDLTIYGVPGGGENWHFGDPAYNVFTHSGVLLNPSP